MIKILTIEMRNGEIYFDENYNINLLKNVDKIKQDILELIKHIQGTYDLKEEIGIPWLDYIGELKGEERKNLIISYMYQKILGYDKANLSNVEVEYLRTVNRESFFEIRLDYLGENIKINTGGVNING